MPPRLDLIRPHVQTLEPYTPGEQPEDANLIKLNTNENPYGPSPQVLRAVKDAVDDRLRLYPHPTAEPLRKKIAALHDCSPDNVIVGNGSDELLALATRAFVEPASPRGNRERQTIQYFTPSYSLYPVLAAIHGARNKEVPLTRSFGIPPAARLAQRGWLPKAALNFVTTPNAPSGRRYRTGELRKLCQTVQGVTVLDEAYAEFAPENALSLVQEFDHVIVSRTFSKAWSLCFQRVGYFVGPESLIQALHRLRDSYNVNGLGQIAAGATLDDLPWYRENIRKVVEQREQLAKELEQLGFRVVPSAANFLLAAPPARSGDAQAWHEEFRRAGILVRHFTGAAVKNYLRITIGTPEQNLRVSEIARRLLAARTQGRKH